MSHYIEEVYAIKWCTKLIQIPYIMHLYIIQLQRQSPSVFGPIPSVKNSSHNPYFPSEDHIMTLISMHLMFQVSIDFCEHSSPNSIGIWKCLLGWQDWSPTMFLFANCSHYILWHVVFGETFTMKGENFAKHIFVKCPPPPKKDWGSIVHPESIDTWHYSLTNMCMFIYLMCTP